MDWWDGYFMWYYMQIYTHRYTYINYMYKYIYIRILWMDKLWGLTPWRQWKDENGTQGVIPNGIKCKLFSAKYHEHNHNEWWLIWRDIYIYIMLYTRHIQKWWYTDIYTISFSFCQGMPIIFHNSDSPPQAVAKTMSIDCWMWPGIYRALAQNPSL
jgi:hypothetical protein